MLLWLSPVPKQLLQFSPRTNTWGRTRTTEVSVNACQCDYTSAAEVLLQSYFSSYLKIKQFVLFSRTLKIHLWAVGGTFCCRATSPPLYWPLIRAQNRELVTHSAYFLSQIWSSSNNIFYFWFTKISLKKLNFNQECIYKCPPWLEKLHKNIIKTVERVFKWK